MHPVILSAVAAERRRDQMNFAAATRRARQARRARRGAGQPGTPARPAPRAVPALRRPCAHA